MPGEKEVEGSRESASLSNTGLRLKWDLGNL